MVETEETLEEWKRLEPEFGVKVFLTVFYSLILILGIVGNSVTIRVTQVLKQNGYLQKNVTDHMVSLACSDLLVLLIGMPVELYSATWYPFTSAEGNVPCKIYNFLFETCSYATILNVATLSFERYLAICHPLRYKALSGGRTAKLIVFAWVTSILVAVPLLITTGTQTHVLMSRARTHHNLTFCTNHSQYWGLYRASIFVAFMVYIVVLGVVAFMCRKMILVLKSTMAPMETATGSSENSSKHVSDKVKSSRKQTILFLGLIIGMLFICWMPNQVRRLMTAAIPRSSWNISSIRSYVVLHPIADTFFYLSSVLNPFLYNLSSRQFRSVFVQVLRCRLKLEHVNRRTVNTSRALHATTRSLQPLLRSLRRNKPDANTCSAPQTDSNPAVPKSQSPHTSETEV